MQTWLLRYFYFTTRNSSKRQKKKKKRKKVTLKKWNVLILIDDIMRAQQGGHLRSAHKVTRSTRLHLYSKPRCSFRKMFAFYRNLLHLLHRSCSGCEVQPQHVRYNHRQKLFITISILADSCGPLLLQRALKKKANLKKLFFCSFKTYLQVFPYISKGHL